MMHLPGPDAPPELVRLYMSGTCVAHPLPDSFFPAKEADGKYIIREYCRHCPVMVDCLEWAVEQKETGIWGGTTDSQRKAIRRRRGMV